VTFLGINGLTIGVIVFLLICLIQGYAKGFVISVLGLALLVVSLFLAHITAPLVTQALVQKDQIRVLFENKADQEMDVREEKNKADQADVIANLPLPEALKNAIQEKNTKESYQDLGVDGFKNYVLYRIASFILGAVVYIVLLLTFLLISFLITRALNLMTKLAGLNGVNKIAGAIVGVLFGFLVLWAACIALTMFASKPWAQEAFARIEESEILSKIYNNNYLLRAITELGK